MLGRNYRAGARAASIDLKAARRRRWPRSCAPRRRVADAARREAEVANRAKTQFFAAASHDLRQPLHAMGLFAEALRQRAHEPEVAQLVNSINESVDALEGLFSELLDITRIDTGGVEVHPQPTSRSPTSCASCACTSSRRAFEKGLALRLRGGQRVVLADPLLVERILRNLVSNAIRYTNDGRVLVSCRAARRAACCCRCGTPASASARPSSARDLRGVLPGAEHATRVAAEPAQGPGPRPGDRQAPGRR